MSHTISPQDLRAQVARIIEKAGSNAAEAFQVADNLVMANLSGHDSHGVGMLPRYVDAVLEGGLKPNQQARVLLDTTRQLAAFSEAGISVLEALTMIGESTRNKRMRAVLQMMADDIRDGETLPQTVRAHGGAFPLYYMAMIDAADRTGNLATTFGTLANYLERDTASRRAVKSALFYPAILVALGSVAVVVLSVVVLPRFAEFFDGLDVPLPTPTRMLLAGTAFVANWWSWLFGAIAASVILLVLTGRTSSGRQVLDRWKLRIPIAGPLLRDIALERFSRVLGNLSGALCRDRPSCGPTDAPGRDPT